MSNTIDSAASLDAAYTQTGSQLRALGGTELARLGDESLRNHLVDLASVAHATYAPLVDGGLESLLKDRKVVRYPVELKFGIGTMAPHQFAQPQIENDRVILHLHPGLKGKEQDISLAIAYFIPVINYGDLIEDDHCLLYGATLSGMPVDFYYNELCRVADELGAISRDRTVNGDRF